MTRSETSEYGVDDRVAVYDAAENWITDGMVVDLVLRPDGWFFDVRADSGHTLRDVPDALLGDPESAGEGNGDA